MGKHIKKPVAAPRTKAALLASAGIGVFATASFAQVAAPNAPLKMQTDYFGYAASASLRGGYSDNINLSRSGLKEDEFSISTMFSGGAIVSTHRVTAIALGDLDFSYLINQGDFVVNQNIGATSTFTGVDNWLYFDLSGATSRQLLGDQARFSGNINAGRNQRANVHNYSASPYVFHEFSDSSTTELRYRFSQVFVDESGSLSSFLTGNSVSDSITHEVLAQYDSGRKLDRMRFRLTAYGSDTTEDGVSIFPDFGYKQGALSADLQFSLTDRFALSGAVGYDEMETQGAAAVFFNDADLSGFFWRAGFTAQPGPRSSIRIEYGERYGDDFIDASARYQISQRFAFTAGASRSFRTRAQSVTSQFSTTQRETLEFADRLREGQELPARDIIEAATFYSSGRNFGSAQTSGVSVTDSAFATLTGDFDMTEISLNGFYSDDNFGYRQIETYGAGLNLNRRLARRVTGYGSVSYRRTDTAFDPATCEANPLIFGLDTMDPLFNAVTDCASLAAQNGVTNTVIGQIGASYRIYENASIFVEATHTERFSPNALLEYNENNLLAGITVDF
ncbi:hypothetical protein ACFOOP_09195 [Marinicaulis aureus]|uniref:TIGR03016 family PEP-CTERM system-associated outer membrane protein n=1 Tax=Hyphococcus aureus TaxID=2666033 RepID=A0ABW1KUD8_9PROT